MHNSKALLCTARAPSHASWRACPAALQPAGSWRAMTADFAAGGDDITGGGTAGTVEDDAALDASVNPDTGLPAMQDANDGGAHAAGFGEQRDPSSAKEQGGQHKARFAKGADTSEIPGDLSSS